MSGHKLIVAAAGSGKTSFLIDQALSFEQQRCLITTFTIENEQTIRQRIIKKKGYIPESITIQTWFSFLLQHGVRPYQGQLYEKKIKGMILVSGQSAQFQKEANVEKHYFSDNRQIYSDKIAKFVVKSDKKSEGAVARRIAKIFPYILIDEVQDLAGYDLEFLKLLFASNCTVTLVGDPRQGTYSTNNSSKNKNVRKGNIIYFFETDEFEIEKDDTLLTTNWRSHADICELSNKLYPDFSRTISGNTCNTGHDGVFFVRPSDVSAYLKKFSPTQLRWDIKTKVNDEYSVLNFGGSKGLEFDRVLIYPPGPAANWLMDNQAELKPVSRSKFYVALTRARHSAAIVLNFDNNAAIPGIKNFVIEE
jgi:DNA helicase-2/ATP-dependent DNA helicase PcrA